MRIATLPLIITLPALSLAALLLPACASAQMPPGGGGRPHDGRGKGADAPRAEQGIPAMIPLADQLEEQLGLALEELKMSPGQLPRWHGFDNHAMQVVCDYK